MTANDLRAAYIRYLDCLNARNWGALGDFVHHQVVHNGRPLGLAGYRAMLERDVAAIPDLRFQATMLVADPPRIAARLRFDCTPTGEFMGLPVNGRPVTFHENVFYEYRDGKIVQVWSVIEKDAIEAALQDR